jgi:hypothetical protein
MGFSYVSHLLPHLVLKHIAAMDCVSAVMVFVIDAASAALEFSTGCTFAASSKPC